MQTQAASVSRLTVCHGVSIGDSMRWTKRRVYRSNGPLVARSARLRRWAASRRQPVVPTATAVRLDHSLSRRDAKEARLLGGMVDAWTRFPRPHVVVVQEHSGHGHPTHRSFPCVARSIALVGQDPRLGRSGRGARGPSKPHTGRRSAPPTARASARMRRGTRCLGVHEADARPHRSSQGRPLEPAEWGPAAESRRGACPQT